MRVLAVALITLPCFAQFEVASIKPSPPDARGMSISTDPGRFDAHNVTLKFLVQSAYRAQEYQVSGGPKWVNSTAMRSWRPCRQRAQA